MPHTESSVFLVSQQNCEFPEGQTYALNDSVPLVSTQQALVSVWQTPPLVCESKGYLIWFLYCKHNVWYKCNSVGRKVEGWWDGCWYLNSHVLRKSSLPTYKAKQNCQRHVRCAAKPQAESHGYCFCYCMTTFFLLLESNFFEGPAVWYCCSFPKDRKTFSCK